MLLPWFSSSFCCICYWCFKLRYFLANYFQSTLCHYFKLSYSFSPFLSFWKKLVGWIFWWCWNNLQIAVLSVVPHIIESEKLFVIGNGARVIYCWEVGLHIDYKSQGILTMIGSTNKKSFHTWDIMHISASHSNNKLKSLAKCCRNK